MKDDRRTIVNIATDSAPRTADAAPTAREPGKAAPPNEIPENFVPGLAGVPAFTTEIAEPDRNGGALRYRGVNVEDLVAEKVEFGDVWGLLVDGKFGAGLPTAEPIELPVHTGDVLVDVQAGLAMLGPMRRYRPLLDIDDQPRPCISVLDPMFRSAPEVPRRTGQRGWSGQHRTGHRTARWPCHVRPCQRPVARSRLRNRHRICDVTGLMKDRTSFGV
jgi:hypothetical protein